MTWGRWWGKAHFWGWQAIWGHWGDLICMEYFRSQWVYKELLELIWTSGPSGTTPLMFASNWGHDNIVRKITQVPGIQLNIRNDDGFSPLTLAVYWDWAECLQNILSVPKPLFDLSRINYKHCPDCCGQGPRRQSEMSELLNAIRRVDPYWNVKECKGPSPVLFCLKYRSETTMATTLLTSCLDLDLDTVDSEGRHLEDIVRSVFNNTTSLMYN